MLSVKGKGRAMDELLTLVVRCAPPPLSAWDCVAFRLHSAEGRKEDSADRFEHSADDDCVVCSTIKDKEDDGKEEQECKVDRISLDLLPKSRIFRRIEPQRPQTEATPAKSRVRGTSFSA